MNALVIESDASFGQALSRSLGRRGFAVEASRSGENAVLRMRHRSYDLVVVEAELVVAIDATSVLHAVRAVDARVPILVVGERGRGCTVAEALTAGADDYLVRPFDVEELFARVHALARRARGGSDAPPGNHRSEP